MNRWVIRKKLSLNIKVEPQISKSSKTDHKARIEGKVFVGENVTIGFSKILTDNINQITIGKETTIKDCVLVTTKEKAFEEFETKNKKIKDIYIGNKVFVSSEVSIYGPVIISDGIFIGHKAVISNAKIGQNCVIEDKATVKNVTLPSDTFIPSKCIIDSEEKLNNLLNISNEGRFCEFNTADKLILMAS